MDKSKTSITVRIDDELYSKLKVTAKKKRRSFNAQLEVAIERYVQNFEKEHGDIALADE